MIILDCAISIIQVKVQELSQDPNTACGKLASMFVLLVTLVVVEFCTLSSGALVTGYVL